MSPDRSSRESPRRTALLAGLVLLLGSLIPSPFERHEAFERVGPDKLLHYLGHAGFAAALADALAAEGVAPRRAGGLAVCGSVLLGLAIGVGQRYVPGRVPELADLVASALGSVVGAGCWYRSGKRY
ncbi:VanZ family protein [Haloarcula rara]|uniref:VanZ family protein n=1 Tax=Haloarcula rara TaxID=3033387 RepID=UPI0023E8AF3D|nr:hypothetical protein [Halomicroarcula sp. SHR3]